MAEKIRTSIIAFLVIINLFGVLAIFFSTTSYKENLSYYNKMPSNADYNITNNYNYNYNYDYNYQHQFRGNNNKNINKYHKKMSYRFALSSFYYKSVLILNCIFLYFCLNMLCSFLIGENECNNCCCNCCRCCNCGGADCNCSCNNNGGASELIACLILAAILIIIYYSTKLCGKHLSRYISLSFIILINFAIIFISLISLNENKKNIEFNLLISSILFICNLFGILIPNCKKKKHNLPYQVFNNLQNPQNQLNSNKNNNVMINNHLNYIQNNPNYIVPTVINEYNNNAYPQIPNEIVSNVNNSNISDNSSNQNLDSSGNLDKAPLPFDIPKSGKEINSY